MAIARDRWKLRLAHLVFVTLFLVAVGLLQWISREHYLKFDLTHNNRNSLALSSIAVAQRLTGPLTATAYAEPHSDVRRAVQELIERYRAHKPDLTLEFVDPDLEPDRARAADVQPGGEIFFAYGDARERISLVGLNEELVTSALTRLGHRGERWIMFLTGHGERSPDREANFDLSIFSAQLRKQGFQVRALSLSETPQIPDNTTALVIAGPRARLLRGEIKKIQAYLARGGNLLWLADPGPLHGLEPVAEDLGVEFHPGTIVDAASETLTGDSTALVAARFSNHPTVRNFVRTAVFPHAAGLSVEAPQGWAAGVLFDTSAQAWSETGTLTGTLTFDKGEDIRGPLPVAVALTRAREDNEQRVLIVGDGDFLANSALANVGNLDLGLSFVNWLSQDDAFIDIPPNVTRDRNLDLSRNAQYALVIVFLFLLPLGLAGGGVVVWRRRRRR